MSTDHPDSDSEPGDGTDEPESVEDGQSNRRAAIAGGAALVVVLLIAAVVLLSGGDDDDDDVALSPPTTAATTSTSTSTTTTRPARTTSTSAVPTTADGADGADGAEATVQPTDSSGPPDTPGPSPSSTPPTENTLPGNLQPIAPDSPRPAPDQPILGEGRVQDPAGLPTVRDIPEQLLDVPFTTVIARFDAAEASNDTCVKLNALASVPDLQALPDLSADDVAGFFERWQAQAGQVAGQVDDDLAPLLTSTRVAMSQIQDIVDREGQGRFQEPANGLILNPGTELASWAAFSATVGQQCPLPPA